MLFIGIFLLVTALGLKPRTSVRQIHFNALRVAKRQLRAAKMALWTCFAATSSRNSKPTYFSRWLFSDWYTFIEQFKEAEKCISCCHMVLTR